MFAVAHLKAIRKSNPNKLEYGLGPLMTKLLLFLCTIYCFGKLFQNCPLVFLVSSHRTKKNGSSHPPKWCCLNHHCSVHPIPSGPNSSVKLSASTIGGSENIGIVSRKVLGQSLGRIRLAVSTLKNYSPGEKQVRSVGCVDFVTLVALFCW
ncbi:unnamed protein product, partial [Vitis vinifera]|uniref:Uncharacterized protein n=1 Tax=Vitis vinifera TaxID=29760 RepID=E0CQS5_VITVI